MRGTLISVLVAAGLVIPPLQNAAVADEAYVCEGGRVAYVRFGQLEAMKRKDPCIAAYYGEVPASAPEAAGDEAAMPRAELSADDSRPVIRTTGSRQPVSARANPVPVLKELPRLATPPATPPAAKKIAASTPAPRTARASAPPPVAHPETDFRNIRILNAGPGESAIFRHAR